MVGSVAVSILSAIIWRRSRSVAGSGAGGTRREEESDGVGERVRSLYDGYISGMEHQGEGGKHHV